MVAKHSGVERRIHRVKDGREERARTTRRDAYVYVRVKVAAHVACDHMPQGKIEYMKELGPCPCPCAMKHCWVHPIRNNCSISNDSRAMARKVAAHANKSQCIRINRSTTVAMYSRAQKVPNNSATTNIWCNNSHCPRYGEIALSETASLSFVRSDTIPCQVAATANAITMQA